MNVRTVTEHKFFKPAVAALIAIAVGIALWHMPLGRRLADASYDYLFRFGARAVTNNYVVLIVMDNEAHKALGETRGKWKRSQHTNLLERLAADGCPLVVFDVCFDEEREPVSDHALADAM